MRLFTTTLMCLLFLTTQIKATEKEWQPATAANKISSITDSFLALLRPKPEQVKNYLGKWTGQIVLHSGEKLPFSIEITVENKKAILRSSIPWNPAIILEPEIFSVSKSGDLVFGRRNQGNNGVVISLAKLDNKGHLSGKQQLFGFVITPDMPDEAKTRMDFIIKNPITFELVKK